MPAKSSQPAKKPPGRPKKSSSELPPLHKTPVKHLAAIVSKDPPQGKKIVEQANPKEVA